jgi:hypothetical protein
MSKNKKPKRGMALIFVKGSYEMGVEFNVWGNGEIRK